MTVDYMRFEVRGQIVEVAAGFEPGGASNPATCSSQLEARGWELFTSAICSLTSGLRFLRGELAL
jgi:hypothetical protein